MKNLRRCTKENTCIGLSPSLVTLRITASLPALSNICPFLRITSPGILSPSIIGNFSSEGTAKLENGYPMVNTNWVRVI